MNLPKFYLIKGLGFVNPYEYNSAFTGELIGSNENYQKLLDLIPAVDSDEEEVVEEELSGYHVGGDYYIVWMTDANVEATVDYLIKRMSKDNVFTISSEEVIREYIERLHIWPGKDWDKNKGDFYNMVLELFENKIS